MSEGIQALLANDLIQIKNILMLGDSLSDRGTLNKTYILGCIPMAALSGLKGRSPDGRFTNGLVWSDHISAQIANDFTIKRLQKKWHMDVTDISDSIIAQEKKVVHAIRDKYTLDDDNFINYNGRLWVRSYCVGGLTSHDYFGAPSYNIVRFFTRLTLSRLEDMRAHVFDYDKKHNLSYAHKAQTLVVEWSGANDLVTVNEKPSIDEVDKAIAARVKNIKKMIESGYRNFVLINLPNLALTPRYQKKSIKEQENAERCTYYFNAELGKACAQLAKEFPHCSIKAFDINTMFETVYNNPEQYLLDSNKLKTPYTSSPDFISPKNGMSPSKGYMFYDDLHPSADVHALLSAYFYDQLGTKYQLLEPDEQCFNKHDYVSEQTLLKSFRLHYEIQLKKDQHSFWGTKKPGIKYKEADLETIFRHALYEDGSRTKKVLTKLGWLDSKGELVLKIPLLEQVMENITTAHTESIAMA